MAGRTVRRKSWTVVGVPGVGISGDRSISARGAERDSHLFRKESQIWRLLCTNS
jgi:hypothetical protein